MDTLVYAISMHLASKNTAGVARQSSFKILLCCGLLSAGSAWAHLGGDLASVQADQQAWGAGSSSPTITGVTVYTQALPNGVIVRQYVNASGLVFAVGWEGPVQPDFERLLGSYFQTYTTTQRQQRRGGEGIGGHEPTLSRSGDARRHRSAWQKPALARTK